MSLELVIARGVRSRAMRGRSRRGSGLKAYTTSRIAPGGFEPPFSDPKSDVLPLDEGAANRSNLHDRCDRLKRASRASVDQMHLIDARQRVREHDRRARSALEHGGIR